MAILSSKLSSPLEELKSKPRIINSIGHNWNMPSKVKKTSGIAYSKISEIKLNGLAIKMMDLTFPSEKGQEKKGNK
jgi:hypothetical protein